MSVTRWEHYCGSSVESNLCASAGCRRVRVSDGGWETGPEKMDAARRAAAVEAEQNAEALARARAAAAALPDPMRDRAGKVGARHPQTARDAAELAAPRMGTQRARIIEVLFLAHASHGRHGLTAAEVADRIEVSRNQTATRLMELREDGWVEYVTSERFPREPLDWPTDDLGNRGLLQVLTRAALDRLADR